MKQVSSSSALGLRSSFQAHFYFIDFRNYTHTAKNPIYFSSIRDPVQRFVSRFFYSRTFPRHYNRLVKANSSHVRGLRKEEWHYKDINQCILTGDPECKLVEGEILDRDRNKRITLAIVSVVYYGYNKTFHPFGIYLI